MQPASGTASGTALACPFQVRRQALVWANTTTSADSFFGPSLMPATCRPEAHSGLTSRRTNCSKREGTRMIHLPGPVTPSNVVLLWYCSAFGHALEYDSRRESTGVTHPHSESGCMHSIDGGIPQAKQASYDAYDPLRGLPHTAASVEPHSMQVDRAAMPAAAPR